MEVRVESKLHVACGSRSQTSVVEKGRICGKLEIPQQLSKVLKCLVLS